MSTRTQPNAHTQIHMELAKGRPTKMNRTCRNTTKRMCIVTLFYVVTNSKIHSATPLIRKHCCRLHYQISFRSVCMHSAEQLLFSLCGFTRVDWILAKKLFAFFLSNLPNKPSRYLNTNTSAYKPKILANVKIIHKDSGNCNWTIIQRVCVCACVLVSVYRIPCYLIR